MTTPTETNINTNTNANINNVAESSVIDSPSKVHICLQGSDNFRLELDVPSTWSVYHLKQKLYDENKYSSPPNKQIILFNNVELNNTKNFLSLYKLVRKKSIEDQDQVQININENFVINLFIRATNESPADEESAALKTEKEQQQGDNDGDDRSYASSEAEYEDDRVIDLPEAVRPESKATQPTGKGPSNTSRTGDISISLKNGRISQRRHTLTMEDSLQEDLDAKEAKQLLRKHNRGSRSLKLDDRALEKEEEIEAANERVIEKLKKTAEPGSFKWYRSHHHSANSMHSIVSMGLNDNQVIFARQDSRTSLFDNSTPNAPMSFNMWTSIKSIDQEIFAPTSLYYPQEDPYPEPLIYGTDHNNHYGNDRGTDYDTDHGTEYEHKDIDEENNNQMNNNPSYTNNFDENGESPQQMQDTIFYGDNNGAVQESMTENNAEMAEIGAMSRKSIKASLPEEVSKNNQTGKRRSLDILSDTNKPVEHQGSSQPLGKSLKKIDESNDKTEDIVNKDYTSEKQNFNTHDDDDVKVIETTYGTNENRKLPEHGSDVTMQIDNLEEKTQAEPLNERRSKNTETPKTAEARRVSKEATQLTIETTKKYDEKQQKLDPHANEDGASEDAPPTYNNLDWKTSYTGIIIIGCMWWVAFQCLYSFAAIQHNLMKSFNSVSMTDFGVLYGLTFLGMSIGFLWSSEVMLTEKWFSRGEEVSRYLVFFITASELLSFTLLTLAYYNDTLPSGLWIVIALNRCFTGLCIGCIETCVNVLVLRWFDEGPMELGMKACYHTLRIRMHGVFMARLFLIPFSCLIIGKCNHANYPLLPGIALGIMSWLSFMYAAQRDEQLKQKKNNMVEDDSITHHKRDEYVSIAQIAPGHSENTPLISKTSLSPQTSPLPRSNLLANDPEGDARGRSPSPKANVRSPSPKANVRSPSPQANLGLDGYHSSRSRLANRENRVSGTPKAPRSTSSVSLQKDESASADGFPEPQENTNTDQPIEFSLKDWYDEKFEGITMTLVCDILYLSIYFGIFFAFVMLSLEIIIEQFGYTNYTANLLLAAIPGVSVIPTRLVGTSVHKFGTKLFMMIACLCFIIAFSLYAYVQTAEWYLPIISVILFIFGSECFMSTGYDELFFDLPLYLQGAVSNLNCACNYFSAMIFCIIFGILADMDKHDTAPGKARYVVVFTWLMICALMNWVLAIINQYYLKRNRSNRTGYEKL